MLALLEQAPVQLLNTLPADGVAVSVTTAPWVKDALQLEPHEIPLGAEVTVPEPCVVTDKLKVLGANTAPTLVVALIVMLQVVLVPVQPPVQFTNR